MLPYSLRGDKHYLLQQEIDAIERSGKSNHMEYATTPATYPTPRIPIDLMQQRPGQRCKYEAWTLPDPQQPKTLTTKRHEQLPAIR